jgi:hypothetical protein
MLGDIVVDTNVMMHAHDPREARQKSCTELLEELLRCDTKLCVDEGFDLAPAKNRSHIGYEYLKHLKFGMLAKAVVEHLATTGRVKMLPRTVPHNVSKHVRTQVGKGPDRTYLHVAYNSSERILASHDFHDIPQAVRGRLLSKIGVMVLAAEEALSKFST